MFRRALLSLCLIGFFSAAGLTVDTPAAAERGTLVEHSAWDNQSRQIPVSELGADRGTFQTENIGEPVLQFAEAGLANPTGRVILTISGAITNTNGDGVARFDREMLMAMGLHTLRTTTSWTDGVKEFEGVLARDIMQAVGVTGTIITATALNDYVVEIPVSDYEKYDVIFALKMDGTELTRRTKGPIWPVYPRDDFPELRNRTADKKWIWQVVTMEIR